jgi:glycosyltransferase involved in cell wall biosynthesis
MPSIPVSAIIIASNAEATIARCLESLQRFDEVVVYLNNSRDATRAICERYANVSVIDGEFIGFGATKNAAVARAGHDWVLSIDSDEWLDDELAAAVEAADLSDDLRAFEVLRKNRFCGEHVRVGGWGNDRLVRLFNRTTGRFSAAAVHELVEIDAGVVTRLLPGSLWHDTFTHIDQLLKKISLYTELAAQGYEKRSAPHPAFSLLRAGWAFFHSYVLQLGFTAGWRGLVIAYARSCGTFFKHLKRYTRSQGLER